MPPPPLPPHLSHQSALALLPPATIHPPINHIRRQHDKQYRRWPAHLNLLYPFQSNPSCSFDTEIAPRIRCALKDVRPVRLRLCGTSVFEHGKKSATVWLRPEYVQSAREAEDDRLGGWDAKRGGDKSGKCAEIIEMQAKLQAEFTECDADDRTFTPHLSVGQARGAEAARALEGKVEGAIRDFLREGNKGKGEVSNATEDQEIASTKDIDEGMSGLEWYVDRVVVIERKGFHARFKVVGEVMLGE